MSESWRVGDRGIWRGELAIPPAGASVDHLRAQYESILAAPDLFRYLPGVVEAVREGLAVSFRTDTGLVFDPSVDPDLLEREVPEWA